MWKWIKESFGSAISDVDGQVSSKRIVTFISVLAVLITWGANLFWGLQITEFIFNGLLYIVVVGLGVTTAEKFSRKGSPFHGCEQDSINENTENSEPNNG